MRRVNHLRVDRPSTSGKLPEQVLPDAALRPTREAVIDRCRRTILGWAIAPAAAALEHMHDAADHAAIVRSLDTSYIRRQMGFDPIPLLITQPEQVAAHAPHLPNESCPYGIRIAFAQQQN